MTEDISIKSAPLFPLLHDYPQLRLHNAKPNHSHQPSQHNGGRSRQIEPHPAHKTRRGDHYPPRIFAQRGPALVRLVDIPNLPQPVYSSVDQSNCTGIHSTKAGYHPSIFSDGFPQPHGTRKENQTRGEDRNVAYDGAGGGWEVGRANRSQGPKIDGDCEETVSRSRIVASRTWGLQLKLGPGNAWIRAKPSRKSRGDTHPSTTTYLKGISSGPTAQVLGHY